MFNFIRKPRTEDPNCAIVAQKMFDKGFTAAAENLAERWDDYSPYKQGRMLKEYFA